MDRLFKTYGRLLAETDLRFTRYLYEKINWDNRLIVIKGAKGVGKTTMILQHILRTFADKEKALYVSLDHLWFANHSVLDLAEYHYTHGGTHLFLDEVHKYKGWQQEVKNIYDSYPDMHIVVTGSSMLKLEESLVGDLSRRHRQYTLEGLSFREYLLLEQVAELPVLTLEQILENHFMEASQMTSKVKVLSYFEKYLVAGYYPFYKEEGDGFADRLQQVIDTIVTSEIPSVANIEYDSVYKAKQLLAILAETSPYTLNISSLCNTLQSSRNNVLKLVAQGYGVKLDGIGIFYPSIANVKGGAESVYDFNLTQNIKGVRFRFTPDSTDLDDLTSKAFGKKVTFGNGYYQEQTGKKAPMIPLAAAEEPEP
ncbi:MAG: AAA family ATPase [Prevotella sp.]|nr:AAA family ATPase [Prevotella sp.]